MTTTLYKLREIPVNPPGRQNGQAVDPPPLAAPTPRRLTGDPWDVRTVRRVWWWLRLPVKILWALTWELDTTYPQARSFVMAHAKGMVSRHVRQSRLESCGVCPHRVVSKGKSYCRQCGCGEHPAANLKWKSRLKAATCPLKPSRWEK